MFAISGCDCHPKGARSIWNEYVLGLFILTLVWLADAIDWIIDCFNKAHTNKDDQRPVEV